MKTKLFTIAALLSSAVFAQDADAPETFAERTELSENKLTIGGYGQIDYNQTIDSDVRHNGKLDVHRVILLTGYKFNDKTSVITELEFEHVNELYVEQAYLNHKINDFVNFKGGLVLIPMGIINELHEPPTFNGVERPNVDSYIVPTTWREIGAGFTGNIKSASIKYQAYVVNGFSGYKDGTGKLGGKKGLRSGRQKGAESFISSPNFSAKAEYYGINGLKLGLAGYYGKTQSTAYDGISKDDEAAEKSADSTVVGVAMVGLDLRYKVKGLELKGQVISTSLSNTKAYNEKTGRNNSDKGLGSAMLGYYAEVGFDVLSLFESEQELTPFVRYEAYNTHQSTDGFEKNDAYSGTELTFGLGYKLAKGAVVKADYQLISTKAEDSDSQKLNLGIGFWF